MKSKTNTDDICSEGVSQDLHLESLLRKAKPDIKTFLEGLENKDFEHLIVRGVLIDSEMKANKKVLDQIKEIMKVKSLTTGEKIFKASSGCSAIVSDKTTGSINPTDFVKKLSKLGKQKHFDDFINVRLTEAIKFLGVDSLSDIIHTNTDTANSCKFKK